MPQGETEIGFKSLSEVSDYYEKYEYDEKNQLVSAYVNGKTSTYEYRPDGLRYSKTVEGDTTYFGMMGDNVSFEYNNDGYLKACYLRGNGLIKLKTNSSEAYYMKNGHGDVVQTVNTNGTVLNDYSYDAFGNQSSSENDVNPFRYCGEYYDSETGNIYLRARYYNPETGRFISQDPIMDGFNWYAYCEGNPLMFKDFTGCSPCDVNSLSSIMGINCLLAEEAFKLRDDCITEYNNGLNNKTPIKNNENLKNNLKIYTDFLKNWGNLQFIEGNSPSICYYDVPIFNQEGKGDICWNLAELTLYAYYNGYSLTNEEAIDISNKAIEIINANTIQHKNGESGGFANYGALIPVNNFDDLYNAVVNYGPIYVNSETSSHTFVISGAAYGNNNTHYVFYSYLDGKVGFNTYSAYKNDKEYKYHMYDAESAAKDFDEVIKSAKSKK